MRESDYYPFGGERVVGTPTVDDPHKFAGMYLDGESGLYHTWFRMYSPSLGRWLAPDPLAGNVENPQSLNRYTYVLNNPVNFVDPLGLEWGPPCDCPPDEWDVPTPGAAPDRVPGTADSGLTEGRGPTGGGGRGGGSDTKRQLPKNQQDALTDCIGSIFNVKTEQFVPAVPGSNGEFVGVANGGAGSRLQITTDSSRFSVSQLNTIRYSQSTPPPRQSDTTGLTVQGRLATKYIFGIGYSYEHFTWSANYVGNNLQPGGAMLANQFHELGHSLAKLLGLAGNGEDPYGGRLEDCINQKSGLKKGN